MSPQQQTVTFEGIKGLNVCPMLDQSNYIGSRDFFSIPS